MPYYSKDKCIYKKGSNKKVGCTKGPIKKYMAALHANVEESLEEVSNISPNLEFKNVRFPSKSSAVATYHYLTDKDNIDVSIMYTIGKTSEELDYCHTYIKDNNDIRDKGISFEDPQSQELQNFVQSKGIEISSDDIEMAGQDGYSKIESYFGEPNETQDAYEESFKFEKLFHSIVNEKKS